MSIFVRKNSFAVALSALYTNDNQFFEKCFLLEKNKFKCQSEWKSSKIVVQLIMDVSC